jgi:micrococcal nuclease
VVNLRRFVILLSVSILLCSLAACALFTPAFKEVIQQPTGDVTKNQLQGELVPAVLEAKVIKVISGDTIEANIADTMYAVRYIGINIPQSFQANKPIEYFQNEALKKNYELVKGKTVLVERDAQDIDKDGHLLRYVWLDTMMVNAELVRLGYMQAICSPPNTKYEDTFFMLEREAQKQGRGLWVVPADAPVTGAFIGSKRSKVYHYSSCPLVANISGSARVYFILAADAATNGYIPCKVCNPPSRSCNAGACDSN